jgi:hypothetical protein
MVPRKTGCLMKIFQIKKGIAHFKMRGKDETRNWK